MALIRWGTIAEQETLTGRLADIAVKAKAAVVQPPVVAVICEVATLRERLRWFKELAGSVDKRPGTSSGGSLSPYREGWIMAHRKQRRI